MHACPRNRKRRSPHAAQGFPPAPDTAGVESTNDGYYTGTTRRFNAELVGLGIRNSMRLFAPRTAAEARAWPHTWQFVDYAFSQTLPAIAAALHGR
jgi:hypothetical protein